MPLTRCSLTGVDETTPLVELVAVSDLYPFVEWSFLYSPDRQGTRGRYPSVARLRRAFKDLPSMVKVALHVCGNGVPQLLDGEPVVSGLFEQVRTRGGRVQLNFDATEGEVDVARLHAFMLSRPDVTFITQHSDTNAPVAAALADVPNRAVLFDASLGRGHAPDVWPAALPSVQCGYAGSLGPEELPRALPRIYEAAGNADFWIAMEGRLRDAHDRFDTHAARICLDIVGDDLTQRPVMPPPRPRRRQCELIDLVDSGLTREDGAERDFEMMLRRLVHATRDSLDPHVATVRRRAENLLLRKGTANPLRSDATAPQVAIKRPNPH
jgi:hypothetical protein